MRFFDVVGAGRIGHGIALCVAMHGFHTRLRDVKQRPEGEEEKIRETAFRNIRETLRLYEEEQALRETPEAIINRISFVKGYEGLEQAFHVVEAVPENIETKKTVYHQLCQHIAEDTLIASTSSSIRPSTIAQFVKTPSRFLVTHWINPAEIIPLVEVAPSPMTSRETIEEAVDFLRRCGKTPVVCGDSPGYVSARLQAALMNEALRIIGEGVASPEAVDTALMAGIGFRLGVHGLMEFLDWGGVDILHKVDEYLAEALQAERFKPPPMLRKLVEEGRLGMERGRGVYDYGGVDVDKLRLSRKKMMIRRLKEINALGILR